LLLARTCAVARQALLQAAHGVQLHNHIAFWQKPDVFNKAVLDFLLAK
jgi:hypothetical protein